MSLRSLPGWKLQPKLSNAAYSGTGLFANAVWETTVIAMTKHIRLRKVFISIFLIVIDEVSRK
jgi:hypothetical protein